MKTATTHLYKSAMNPRRHELIYWVSLRATMYWLGGLDSNQDSQIQSLESYQLDDLPAGRNKKESRHVRLSRQPRFTLPNLIGFHQCVNQPHLHAGFECVPVATTMLMSFLREYR